MRSPRKPCQGIVLRGRAWSQRRAPCGNRVAMAGLENVKRAFDSKFANSSNGSRAALSDCFLASTLNGW